MLDSSDYNTKEIDTSDLRNKIDEDNTTEELREVLEERGLKKSGNKPELIDRLIDDIHGGERNTRTYTFTADGTQIEAEDYQEALDKYNS